jgi:hypothetical protein
MAEGIGALLRHMDEMAALGWEPFHVHESILSGTPCFLLFSRNASETLQPPQEEAATSTSQ